MRQLPALSCSVVAIYILGLEDGKDAILWKRSNFFMGTWVITQLEVPKYICVSYALVAPEPMAAIGISGEPPITFVLGDNPIFSATSAFKVPKISVERIISGSLDLSIPNTFINLSTYVILFKSRISEHHNN